MVSQGDVPAIGSQAKLKTESSPGGNGTAAVTQFPLLSREVTRSAPSRCAEITVVPSGVTATRARLKFWKFWGGSDKILICFPERHQR
jgi:hypothetical protein